jgi:hypothetical protein
MVRQHLSKVLLTIAILLLLLNLFSTIVSQSQEKTSDYSRYQFSGSMGGFWLFDSKSGEIWAYDSGGKDWKYLGKLVEPGEPLDRSRK